MDDQPLRFSLGELPPRVKEATSSTFVDNMRLPVHRWFRFSAGFSASWAESIIIEASRQRGGVRVFDPFAGSGTTLISAENRGVASYGTEAHPFLYRIARAKLLRRSPADTYKTIARKVLRSARRRKPGNLDRYPALIQKCFDPTALGQLDVLRQAVESVHDEGPPSELVWLTLVSIVRQTSHANTAPWQYVLPNQRKKNPTPPFVAFQDATEKVYRDMLESQAVAGPSAQLVLGDARTCEGVPDRFANLVITSPPYPNNFDYADATRLEMSFLQQIRGWGDLKTAVRQYLVRSCSQHVPQRAVRLDRVLASAEVAPIRTELTRVCHQLSETRKTKGGKKTYHLMVACYFYDLAQVWRSLRRVCDTPCRVCFVVGDSAPYGVHVPVIEWLGAQAIATGFSRFSFERTRDRNVKWKNRKHRVPLCEGRLWVDG